MINVILSENIKSEIRMFFGLENMNFYRIVSLAVINTL